MSGLSSPICSWQSSLLSHSISNCTNYVQSLGVKVLAHSFFLSVEFGAIVSGTWNQPAYKNQTELQKHVVFSTNKKYSPTDWRFWCYRNCSRPCSCSHALSFGDAVLGSRPANTETGGAVLTVSDCLNSGQPVLIFFSFLPLLSYLFLFFPLGNELKPV